ncbi:MAG: hypothetical protein NVS1B11_25750 [Terriglobales bacterium]
MSDESQAEIESGQPAGSHPQEHWKHFCARLAKMPRKAWMVLAIFLIAAFAMALYTHTITRNDAMLHLRVQHNFRSAKFSLFTDGNLVYAGKLNGSVRKRFGVLPESVQGSLTQAIPISSGSHQLRVEITADDGTIHSDAISGDFASGGDCTLSVIARRGTLSLNWQGLPIVTAPSAAVAAPAQSGFLQRYGGAMMMSVIGSIISAITGFAIREFPKQLGSRTEKA